jgi:hypothetical protein
MEQTLGERLQEMIAALKNWQEFLSDNGHSGSSRLLKVAALDLQMKLHNISDAELKEFCDTIRRKRSDSATPGAQLATFGPHFNGSRGLTPAQNVVIMRSVKTTRSRKTNNRG